MPRFTVIRDGKPERSLVVEQDLIRIGRLTGVEILLASPTVSREHARIKREGPGYIVVDIGSVNGFLIDGQRVKWHALKPGDAIEIEPFRIIYEPSQEIFESALDSPSEANGSPPAPPDRNMTFLDLKRFIPPTE